MSAELDALVETVCRGPRYRALAPALVRTIAEQELLAHRNTKLAVKATRAKLHQVAGVYLDRRIDVPAAIAELGAAVPSDDATIRRCCLRLLAGHVSTRERLSIMEPFYRAIFARTGPVRGIVDLGCGLNPLAIPWMRLAAPVVFHAYDAHADVVRVLNAAWPALAVSGGAQVADVLGDKALPEADLTLILKCLPCFEQIDHVATRRLLARLRSRHVVVSFPVRTLGGRAKGMAASYEAQFRRLVEQLPWRIERLDCSEELVFVATVTERPSPPPGAP